ncbi:hypothetical protein LTR08_006616 [Meristemomyces frigidus]|nr:hypothetical protein LTR08_006616 [Meristemomyces frigidus]
MTPSPVTSIIVVTIAGAIVTQTVTSTPMVVSTPDSGSLQRKGLSKGAIAGAVIGALLGLAAVLSGAFLLWRRRKQDGDAEGTGAGVGRGPVKNFRRNTSVMSKTGLLSRGRPASTTEKEVDGPLYINTHTGNNSVRHSMLFAGAAGAAEGVSPVSPLGNYTDRDSTRRYSRPLVYDQRLNPSVLFANAQANGSRVSIQDQQDYSRPLGITNPDPRPSFESRA